MSRESTQGTAPRVPEALVERLHRDAGAERWDLPIAPFASALEASVDRARPADVEGYVRGLHLEDLALACACASGNERAWEHFVRELRPVLYRAADALRPGGGRDLADSLYADLYGLQERDGERRSLFRYFHGRSSLATWLRAVLSQRLVDAVRVERRLDPLTDEDAESARTLPAVQSFADPDRPRYAALMQLALKAALAALSARDRLRVACYYAQELTLAETGRILKEHEATVSRQLAKSRRTIRAEVDRYLRAAGGLNADQAARCVEYALEDIGPLDLGGILRKDSASDRSI
jgi:RNA polymerase sigma-70 factor, ECF subfamily